MRLVEVMLNGFQSYRTAQHVLIEPDVTFLVGRNNVGKSALLRALQLWHEPQEGLASDFRLAYTWRADRDWLGTQIADIAQMPTWGSLSDEVKLFAGFGSTTPQAGPGALMCTELRLEGLIAAPSPNGQLAWRNQPSPASTRGAAGLATLASEAAASLRYVAPRRIELMPSSMLYEQTRLEPDGRNLANVLRHLRETYPRTKWREVMSFMVEAFPEIEDLTLPSVPDQSSSQGEPKLHYQGVEDAVPLRLSGTGVQQLLSLVAALVMAEDLRLVLIDEPQAYLHPHAERALAGLIARHPTHQYILATHSSSLLRTARLSSTRLLTLGDQGTHRLDVDRTDTLLNELGITAAELWLPDAILWVEGATEQRVLATLMAHDPDFSKYVGVSVREIPAGASQFVGTSAKRAEVAYRFCEEAVAAVTPVKTRVRFLFDRDGKTPAMTQRLTEISGNRARFLSVREIENLFLDATLLDAFFTTCTERFELDRPTPGAVASRLAELLSNTSGASSFADGPPETDDAPEATAKGSEVLNVLCNELLNSEYRKVEYAQLLTELALECCPDRLEPLQSLLSELSITTR